MNTSEAFSEGYKYTRTFLSRVGDLIILLVISIIPIVNFIAIGYYGRVIRDRPDSQAPPALHNFWDLFVGGLKALVALLIWSIPLILLSLVFFIPTDRRMHFEQMMMYASQPLAFFMGTISALMVMAFFIIEFLIGILALMGVIHMFKTSSFVKAFAVGELFSIIGKIGFLRYLFWLIVATVLGAVAGGFGMIPMVGWIISDLLSIILFIFLARSIGLMYDATVVAPPPPSPTPQTPIQPPPPPP